MPDTSIITDTLTTGHPLGEGVMLFMPEDIASDGAALMDLPLFRILAMALLAAYCYCLLAHTSDLRNLVMALLRGERRDQPHERASFETFIRSMNIMGTLALALALCCAAARLTGQSSVSNTVTLYAAAGMLGWELLRLSVLWISGALSSGRRYSEPIIECKFINFSGFSLAGIPASLLAAFSSGASGIAICSVGAVLAAYAAVYVWRLIRLFASENISVFFLILYLCAVEIIPVVTVIMLAGRS